MLLERLAIRAFRNLQPLTLDLGPGVHLFHGANGQGKTNLLEAISLLINGSSPRTSSLAETIPWDQESAELAGVQEAYGVHYRVALVIRAKGKVAQVDGVSRRSVPGVAKGCLALTFLPEDLAILTSEPSLRRDFLDHTLTLWDAAHAADLRAYQGAMLARGRVLKDLAARGSAVAQAAPLLEPYEQILLARGAAIMQRRALLSEQLEAAMKALSGRFSIPLTITCHYEPQLPQLLTEGIEAARALMIERRQVDLYQKRTTLGPHRDELRVECKGAGVRTYASRGETRLAMVLLLIAKLEVVMQRLQFTPVIVLDDIFSELDRERRALVIRALPPDAQVFCSAVERDLDGAWVAERGPLTAYQVASGQVTVGGL